MLIRFLLTVLACGLAVVAWGNPADRPNLAGSWELAPSQSEVHSRIPAQLTWQIEQSENEIHLIQRTQDKKSSDDIRCATDGKDCRIREEGRSATVSFYYNGPALVELETEGQNRDIVTKRRMHVSGDGSTLTVDVIYVMPTGKPPEKLVLTKQAAGADH